MMFLVRHGATEANESGRLQGRGVDLPLSKAGRMQAAHVSQALAATPLAAVYATPLLRAQETAAAVARPHGLSATLVDELIEVDVGRWEGQTWEQIQRDDADAYRQFMESFRRDGRCSYPDGESYDDVHRRVRPVLDRLVQQHEGEHIAVIAHSVVNRVYLAGLLGLPPSAARELSQANGAINVIRRRYNRLQVVTLNALTPPA